MSLKLTAKKLYLLEFLELVKLALRNPGNISQNETETDGSVMFASETALIPDRKPSENHNLKPSSEAQNVSDAQPLCALSDPDQHGQPVRALWGCDIREDQGQLPEDVLPSAGQSTHCLRGGKIESQVQGCDRTGSQVHSMVCQEVRGFAEASPSGVPALQSALHGTTGDDIGIRPFVQAIDLGAPSKVQGHASRSPRRQVPTAGQTRRWNPSHGVCSTKRPQP